MFEMGWFEKEPADSIREVSLMTCEKKLDSLCKSLNVMVMSEVTFVGKYG